MNEHGVPLAPELDVTSAHSFIEELNGAVVAPPEDDGVGAERYLNDP
jgi:hypothetical protein